MAGLRLLAKHLTGVIVPKGKSSQCKPCIIAKHTCFPHPSSFLRAKGLLDLVHTDTCGPFLVQTPHGKLYFTVFLDDHSGCADVQLLAKRDQALEA